jgi:hypothetical protein
MICRVWCSRFALDWLGDGRPLTVGSKHGFQAPILQCPGPPDSQCCRARLRRTRSSSRHPHMNTAYCSIMSNYLIIYLNIYCARILLSVVAEAKFPPKPRQLDDYAGRRLIRKYPEAIPILPAPKDPPTPLHLPSFGRRSVITSYGLRLRRSFSFIHSSYI